jgi:hypothetical protein
MQTGLGSWWMRAAVCRSSVVDCRRAAARLSDAVAEYEMKGEIQDYVWNRKGLVTLPPDGKVAMINRRKPADAAPGAQADKH